MSKNGNSRDPSPIGARLAQLLSPAEITAGMWLALLNVLLIGSFFGGQFLAVAINRWSFLNHGRMFPVVPMVLLAFMVLSPLCWYFAGLQIQLVGASRLKAALIGTLPIFAGIGLAFVMAVASVLLSAANPGSVVIPIVASAIGVVAATINVGIVVFAGRSERN